MILDDFLNGPIGLHYYCHGTNVRHKLANQAVEGATYLEIFLVSGRWARHVEMRSSSEADIKEITADAFF